jgi:hypothetical protein
MLFGDRIEVQHDINKATLDFFDRFFASQRVGQSGSSN